MSRDLGDLTPTFQLSVAAMLEACAARGVTMRPFFTLRTPHEQARLWRQSRSREEVAIGIRHLHERGAPWLADVLAGVGPQSGPPVTKALPGASWHQWGVAVDCFWLVGGVAVWDTVTLEHGPNGYDVMGEEAKRLGLTWGGAWRMRDSVHVQEPAASSPLSQGWPAVDAAMRERWG